MTERIKKLGYPRAAAIFLGFTAYFYLLVLFLIPWLKSSFALNPALHWFITGYCLFLPMFVGAILLARKEGRASAKAALAVKPLGRKDWSYVLGGTLLCFLLSGGIMGAASSSSDPGPRIRSLTRRGAGDRITPSDAPQERSPRWAGSTWDWSSSDSWP